MSRFEDKLRRERAEKAVKNLSDKGIEARIDADNDTIYVSIDCGFIELEISEFETNFQATEYDEKLANGIIDNED